MAIRWQLESRIPVRLGWAVVCGCALAVLLGQGNAAWGREPKQGDVLLDLMITPGRVGPAAGTLVSAGMTPVTGMMGQLAVLYAGLKPGGGVDPFWVVRDTSIVQPLDPANLAKVADDQPLPRAYGENLPDDQIAELTAYVEAVVFASWTPNETMARFARQGLGFPDLYNVDLAKPPVTKGQVVYFNARLLRLRAVTAPVQVTVRTGLTQVYEGWVATDASHPDWVVVLFTELPPGLEPAERMNVPISVAGYYFKRLRYTPAHDTQNTEPLAPLIIAHTLTVSPAVAEVSSLAWVNGVLPLLLSFLVVVILFVAGLAIWFRQMDASVRRRLEIARRKEFVMPAPEEVPLAAPVPPLAERMPQAVNRIAAFDGGSPAADPERRDV